MSMTLEDALRISWHEGEPPRPFKTEWFIAETIYGDRVVLKALPEEWTYDYKTADDTYIMATNIKRWMQFPDSQFIPHAPVAGESEAEAVKGGFVASCVSCNGTGDQGGNPSYGVCEDCDGSGKAQREPVVTDEMVKAALGASGMEGWDHIEDRMRDAITAALRVKP